MFKACLTILDPTAYRNQTVVFAPIYEAFDDMPRFITGKEPIILNTDENFYPVVEDLKNVLEKDDRIALVFLNSPNNPTGVVYPPSLIESLANVLLKFPHVAVIWDEVYRTIIYDTPYTSIAKYIPEQTLVVGGMSKEVAGTGMRVGYVAGPEQVVTVVAHLQGNASSCVTLPLQKAFARFLRADRDMEIRYAIRDQLKARRDLFISLLRKHESLHCFKFKNTPSGAFYLFPNVEALYGKVRPDGQVIGHSDLDVVKFLIEIAHVATVPGSGYSVKGHIRMAYSRSTEEIEAGLQVVADAVAQLTDAPTANGTADKQTQ